MRHFVPLKLTCKRDLEGIVAKRKYDPTSQRIKIRNTASSQRVGREKPYFGRESKPIRVFIYGIRV